MHQNVTTVALYDTLGPDAAKFVFNQTQMTSVTCSHEFIKSLCKLKLEDAKDEGGKMNTLVNIICYESSVTDEDKKMCEEASINLHTMEQVIFKGREAVKNGTASVKEPTADDVYMFSYTSGTTGDPKGVKLTHRMVISSAYGVNHRVEPPFNTDDCYISYLPAAHSFEQITCGISIIYGMKCGFFAGNVQKLTDDIALL
jgi:long-chain acyl-CoA synthetase